MQLTVNGYNILPAVFLVLTIATFQLRVESSQSIRIRRIPNSHLHALTQEKLLQLAQDYANNPTLEALSDDFVFRGPVIGPLTKTDFAKTLEAVANNEYDIAHAFPDLQSNNFGFTAEDPVEPNRVWYFTRPRGTFTGAFDHPVVGRIDPTGAEYIASPEARSVIFNDDGKVRYQSVGYVTNRFTGDTTGGRGAVIGLYAVMGQELDDTIGSWATIFLQKLTEFLPEGAVPRSYSKKETLPSWWKDDRMGAEK
jgi:hypothetical protein